MYQQKIRAENYRYLQNTIAGLILQIRLREPRVNLSDVTQAISEESTNMGAAGLEYIRTYLRNYPEITQITKKQNLPEQEDYFNANN